MSYAKKYKLHIFIFHIPLTLGFVYLFISHKLYCRLRGNFEDVDPVASPQRPYTTLSDHLRKATSDAHTVALGGVNLGECDEMLISRLLL